MQHSDWGDPVSFGEICRRASGRRRWNAVRRLRAAERRCRMFEWIATHDAGPDFLLQHGMLQLLAAQFGVSVAQACRDRQAILHEVFHVEPAVERCGCLFARREAARRAAQRQRRVRPSGWARARASEAHLARPAPADPAQTASDAPMPARGTVAAETRFGPIVTVVRARRRC